MGASRELGAEAEVRVWETEENSRGDSTDEYNVVVRDGDLVTTFHFWTEERPLEIYIRSEYVDLADIPEKVASVMQEYMDDSILSWPETFDSRIGEVDREQATVDVWEIEDGDEERTRYRFHMWTRDFVDVSRNGERIDRNAVPPAVLAEAEQYIPTDVEYFFPP